MATKRTNYAKVKLWGDKIVAEFEGSILGCMTEMLLMVPAQNRGKFIEHLQKVAADADEKRGLRAPLEGSPQ